MRDSFFNEYFLMLTFKSTSSVFRTLFINSFHIYFYRTAQRDVNNLSRRHHMVKRKYQTSNSLTL
jgi:hypothetical protein